MRLLCFYFLIFLLFSYVFLMGRIRHINCQLILSTSTQYYYYVNHFLRREDSIDLLVDKVTWRGHKAYKHKGKEGIPHSNRFSC